MEIENNAPSVDSDDEDDEDLVGQRSSLRHNTNQVQLMNREQYITVTYLI
jgi:hypothetical protein